MPGATRARRDGPHLPVKLDLAHERLHTRAELIDAGGLDHLIVRAEPQYTDGDLGAVKRAQDRDGERGSSGAARFDDLLALALARHSIIGDHRVAATERRVKLGDGRTRDRSGASFPDRVAQKVQRGSSSTPRTVI